MSLIVVFFTAIMATLAFGQEVVRVGEDETVVTAQRGNYLKVDCHVYKLAASDDNELARREIGERYTNKITAAETFYQAKEDGISSLKDSDQEAWQAAHDAHEATYEEACRVAGIERDDALSGLYQTCDELLPTFTDIVIGVDEPFRVFYYEGIVDNNWCITFYEPWRFYRGPRWCYDWGYRERVRFDRIRNFRRDYERHADHTIFGWRDRNDRRQPPIRSAFHVREGEQPRMPEGKIDRHTGHSSWAGPRPNDHPTGRGPGGNGPGRGPGGNGPTHGPGHGPGGNPPQGPGNPPPAHGPGRGPGGNGPTHGPGHGGSTDNPPPRGGIKNPPGGRVRGGGEPPTGTHGGGVKPPSGGTKNPPGDTKGNKSGGDSGRGKDNKGGRGR